MSVINKNLKMSGRELLGRDEITEEMIAGGSVKSLFIGAGDSTVRLIKPNEVPDDWEMAAVTLDISGDCDVEHDLNVLPYPFRDNEFDEIHAYEVLEHIGTQGDEFFFFAQFNEFHRILKPNGYLCGSVPMPNSVWAWGDPSHSRVLPKEVFSFLQESQYEQLGKTPCADYRHLIKGYWKVGIQEKGERLFFQLEAV